MDGGHEIHDRQRFRGWKAMLCPVHGGGHAHGGHDEERREVVRPRFKVDEVDVGSIGTKSIASPFGFRLTTVTGTWRSSGFHGFSTHVA